jgi:hypothetical protein
MSTSVSLKLMNRQPNLPALNQIYGPRFKLDSSLPLATPIPTIIDIPRWKPARIKSGYLFVNDGLAKTYMNLFVNRLSYRVQADNHDDDYLPRHKDILHIAEQQALAGHQTAAEYTDSVNRNYELLVKAHRKPTPYLGLDLQTITEHLRGDLTVSLFAINPKSQRCKWIAINSGSNTVVAQKHLAFLRSELLQEGVYAVQEQSRYCCDRLWVFCKEPLDAKKCRAFIYNLALRLKIPIKGPAADGIKIFPKQDSTRAGEFSDALRAPLGVDRKNDRDTRYWFIGDTLQTLDAQIKYLDALPKLTAEKLDVLIQ